MLEFQILECRSRTQTASQQNALFGGKLHSSELEVLTCPVGVFVASLVRTLQRYVHSPRYAITSQLGGDLGCGVVGVFHDFLEPALLSGWPVFQLIHFFTSIVTRSSGQAVHSLQVLSYSSRVTNAKCVNQDKTKSLRSLSYRNVRTEAL